MSWASVELLPGCTGHMTLVFSCPTTWALPQISAAMGPLARHSGQSSPQHHAHALLRLTSDSLQRPQLNPDLSPAPSAPYPLGFPRFPKGLHPLLPTRGLFSLLPELHIPPFPPGLVADARSTLPCPALFPRAWICPSRVLHNSDRPVTAAPVSIRE